MFRNTSIGLLLLLTHILGSLTVGVIFRFWKSPRFYKKRFNRSFNEDSTYSNSSTVDLSNLGGILGESISNSISTLLTIGGFVVLFSVIISILQISHFLN